MITIEFESYTEGKNSETKMEIFFFPVTKTVDAFAQVVTDNIERIAKKNGDSSEMSTYHNILHTYDIVKKPVDFEAAKKAIMAIIKDVAKDEGIGGTIKFE